MKKQQIKAGIASALLGLVSPLSVMLPASAATVTWTGEGDGGFNSAVNWGGGVAVTGDTIVFPASANYQMPNNDMTGQSYVKMIFNGEVTGSSSKSYTITGNELGVTSAIEAIMTGLGGDHQVLVDVTLGGDVTFKTTGSNTLTVGDDGKTLDLGSNDLTLQADGGSISLAGEIDGSGKIVKKGTGKVKMLAAPADGYTGSTEVTEGEYVVSATSQDNLVINGGTLKGSSDLLGTVTMSAGKVAPGMSPGCIGTSDLTLTGGAYDVEIGGKTICTEYDQITVVGSVNLGTATTLNIQRINDFEPAVNDAFAIILNDGSDAVQGTFSGMADGSKTTVDGYTYQINYDAGDGNDVLLLVTGTPSAPDTGVGGLLSNPLVTISAMLTALFVVGGLKYADSKRK